MSPEMTEILKWIVTTLLTVVSVFIAVSNLNRDKTESDKAEVEERTRREVRTDAKLDEAIQLSRDTKDSVSELRREIGTHNDRIIRTEENLKGLTKSLSGLDERVQSVEKRLSTMNGGDTYG